MRVSTESILEKIHGALPSTTVSFCKCPGPSGQHSLLVDRVSLHEVCLFLRDELGFDFLSNVTGIDWPEPAKATAIVVADGDERLNGLGFIEVVYHLYSTSRREGPLVLRARTEDRISMCVIPSVVSIYRSAEFQEREIYDLYGVVFTDHPDLRRILMWDEFSDHPMRKDYVAPDDYDYEPTPHDAVLEKAKRHYPVTT